MGQIQLKLNGLWRSFLVFGILFGITEQMNSSVILSTITSRVSPSSSGNSSLSTTSTFYGILLTISPTFLRPYGSYGNLYFYQAIEVTVYESAAYSLQSSSSIDTFGCLYDTIFDPSNPQTNLVAYDDDSGGSGQFLINYYLQSGRTYILVVTTYSPSVYGSYSIIATGSYTVYMREIPVVTTTHSGYLSSSNPTFVRPDGDSSSDYYYDSIEVTNHTSGSYTFKSSSFSSLDTYGCLYIGSFDPSYPSSNKLTCDDDSGGSLQFQFTQNLYSYNTYILVVTTFASCRTGSYSVAVTGPSSISLTSITPNRDPSTLTPIQIIAISICCVVFLAIIVMIISACRRRQRILINRQVVSPIQNAQNVRQINVVGTPYPTPKPPGYPIIVEEDPPSYQAYISTLRP